MGYYGNKRGSLEGWGAYRGKWEMELILKELITVNLVKMERGIGNEQREFQVEKIA